MAGFLYHMQDKSVSGNPFSEWMDRHDLTVREVAAALGCSKNTVANWRQKTPPRYILLACAAWSLGIPPIQ